MDAYVEGLELANLFSRFGHALKRAKFPKSRIDAQSLRDRKVKLPGPAHDHP
jgi:hypothetical protein